MEKETSFLYLLEIKDRVYKFGITDDLTTRLNTHKRSLDYKRCLQTWEYTNTAHARFVETGVKRFLADSNLLVNYLDNNNHFQTEIFTCDDPEYAVNIIEDTNKAYVNEVAQMDVVDKPRNKKKCDKCGKKFRTPAELTRHNNRKIACIVNTKFDNDTTDSNLICEWCNRRFSTKGSRDRHLSRCVIRNNGSKYVSHEDTVEKDTTIKELLQALLENNNKLLQQNIKIIEENEKIINKLKEFNFGGQ